MILKNAVPLYETEKFKGEKGLTEFNETLIESLVEINEDLIFLMEAPRSYMKTKRSLEKESNKKEKDPKESGSIKNRLNSLSNKYNEIRNKLKSFINGNLDDTISWVEETQDTLNKGAAKFKDKGKTRKKYDMKLIGNSVQAGLSSFSTIKSAYSNFKTPEDKLSADQFSFFNITGIAEEEFKEKVYNGKTDDPLAPSKLPVIFKQLRRDFEAVASMNSKFSKMASALSTTNAMDAVKVNHVKSVSAMMSKHQRVMNTLISNMNKAYNAYYSYANTIFKLGGSDKGKKKK